MTITPSSPAASQQAAVDAARLVLQSMGLSLDDLTAAPANRKPMPTFAEYVPVVRATVTPGTLKTYGSYWNRVVEQWGDRHLTIFNCPGYELWRSWAAGGMPVL